MKRLMERGAAVGVIVVAVLSALETIASVGTIVIVFGELAHWWDLL